jgi:hypothetical protein
VCVGSLVISLSALAGAVHAQPRQIPRFQASVDVTSLDVTVVDASGRPVMNLTPADFTVRIQGIARRVVSAEWVSLVTPERNAPPPPPGYSSNESATGGRLIVFVVDQPNIRFGGAGGIRTAINGVPARRRHPSPPTATGSRK